MTGTHRDTSSTLFLNICGCPVVWSNDVCATLGWALIMVIAYSVHKGPGMTEPGEDGQAITNILTPKSL